MSYPTVDKNIPFQMIYYFLYRDVYFQRYNSFPKSDINHLTLSLNKKAIFFKKKKKLGKKREIIGLLTILWCVPTSVDIQKAVA